MKAKAKKMEFAVFMSAVDSIIGRKYGIDSADLPDFNYRDMYEDGMSPASAARAAIKNANDE